MPTPPPLPDETLLARASGSDWRSLALLADRYERMLLGLAYGVLAGRDDLARDAVQETWIRVMRSAHSFRGQSSFKTWIYQICLNECRTIQRVLEREQRRTGAVPLEPVRPPAPPPANADDLTRLRAAVDGLSEQQRLIVLLCYHHGMTLNAAAEILEIPPGTLRSRLNAILTELRERLNPKETA